MTKQPTETKKPETREASYVDLVSSG